MRWIFLLAVSICASVYAFAQADSISSKKYITLATDLVLDALNEKNLSAEWKFSRRWAIGLSYGIVDSSKQYSDHRLIRNHDKYPGRVYEGTAVKLNAKYYTGAMEGSYLQLSLLYKNLRYDTAFFSDGWDRGGSDFRRANERAHLYGADLLFGKECTIFKYAVLDFFAGLGFRARSRSYNTYYSQSSTPWRPPLSGTPPTGLHHVVQYYLSPVLGVKIGGRFYTK